MMNTKLLRFRNWLRQLARWWWAGRYHLLSSATFLVTVLYLTRVVAFYPKVISLLMTLTGLTIILTQQILDASKFSAHRPNTVTKWLKLFPTGKPISLSVEGGASLTISCKAHATVSISHEAAVERKVEFLLTQLKALDSAVAKIDDRVDSVKSDLGNTEKKLQASIDALTASVNAVVASHVVGAYDLNLLGINITICGTIIQFFSE